MKPCLTLKIMGAREEIEVVIDVLESRFDVRATSRFLKNQQQRGYHVYIDLMPKRGI